MTIQIVGKRLSGGTTIQHIVRLWWVDPANGDTGNNSRAEIVSWIEDQNGKAYVQDSRGNRVDVLVVKPSFGEKYLRTRADGICSDNLLALPDR